MSRVIATRGWLVVAAAACLIAGCLSGGYEEDFQTRLQEYKRQAAGEPAAVEPAAEPAAPPAEGGAE